MNESIKLAEVLPVICEVVEGGGAFTFFPRGTSMLPTLVEKRDSVTLSKAEKLSKGDIILYRRNDGAFVLHRIIGKKDGTFTMRGDNQTFNEKGIMPDMIIAKVISYTHNGKKIERNSFLYRFHYVFAFLRAFLRRFVYGVWRKIKKIKKVLTNTK